MVAGARSEAHSSPLLPNFLVIGAMKAGTTALYHYLRSHPQVFVPDTKELHFFPTDKNWSRGIEWYEAHFVGSERCLIRGEVSPSYSQADQFPGVAARVADLLPDVRLVYIVREPIERMRSMFLHQVASGAEGLPVERALRENPIYSNSSRYAWQLEQYLPRFGRERVHLLTNEQLGTDPGAALRSLFRFLGVDEDWLPDQTVEAGRTDAKRVRSPAARKLAANPVYRAVIDRLPPNARAAGRRIVTRPIDPEAAAISPELTAELHERLLPDVARLRALYPELDLERWGPAWR